MASVLVSILLAVLEFANAASAALGGTPKACSITTLSCQNTTAVADTCCFNAPGGQLLQTQFWDTDPVTGPDDSWTIHGLWPDHCDGTFDSSCDLSRAYTDITGTLQSAGETGLLSYMQDFWQDINGNDETFWEHEWSKHGTCISTLNTKCYTNYTPREELIDFLHTAVNLFKTLPTHQFLANAGITPSSSKTYSASAIQAALTSAHGQPVTIGCQSGQLNEVWYHFHVRGSVQTGQFVAAAPDGTKSTCTGSITYAPKGTSSSPPPGSFNGKGFLNVSTGGASRGCLISAGTWFTTGTCATYTAAPASNGGFTLTSSKGPCAIVSGAFKCASGTTPGVFSQNNGKLVASGTSTNWAAEAVPAGQVQESVYTTASSTRTVILTIGWQST